MRHGLGTVACCCGPWCGCCCGGRGNTLMVRRYNAIVMYKLQTSDQVPSQSWMCVNYIRISGAVAKYRWSFSFRGHRNSPLHEFHGWNVLCNDLCAWFQSRESLWRGSLVTEKLEADCLALWALKRRKLNLLLIIFWWKCQVLSTGYLFVGNFNTKLFSFFHSWKLERII